MSVALQVKSTGPGQYGSEDEGTDVTTRLGTASATDKKNWNKSRILYP